MTKHLGDQLHRQCQCHVSKQDKIITDTNMYHKWQLNQDAFLTTPVSHYTVYANLMKACQQGDAIAS